MSPGVALTVGLVVGAVLGGVVGFMLGVIATRDRRVTHTPYVGPSLRRSVR